MWMSVWRIRITVLTYAQTLMADLLALVKLVSIALMAVAITAKVCINPNNSNDIASLLHRIFIFIFWEECGYGAGIGVWGHFSSFIHSFSPMCFIAQESRKKIWLCSILVWDDWAI